jgi:hypothetical protein
MTEPLRLANIATVKVHGKLELHLKFANEMDLLEAYARITRAELPPAKPIAKIHDDGYWTAMDGFKEPLNFAYMEVYAK